MLFPSFEFVFQFLPVALLGFFVAGLWRHELAAGWLAAASLWFYSRWDPRFVALLLASIAFNYVMALLLARSEDETRRRRWLTFAVAADLGLLAVYKYTNFFIDTLNQTTGAQLPHANIVLPLGISFFTFTQIAFLVDVHRGRAREYRFVHYVLFVTYFPHLIAGPVLHHKQMMPQFGSPEIYRPRADNFAPGIAFFAIGLAKKIVLADGLSTLANQIFDGAAAGTAPGTLGAWAGALSYTLQIYFDFSGYSDMAIGLALMCGIDLPLNFASPYKATSIIEFWRRWHMTLSTFLRDYLYVPLGGNRLGRTRRFVNLAVTMLLGGLWHGASWTFVVWGGLHGAYLIVNHAWRALVPARANQPGALATAAAVAVTFGATVIAWVFFRAADFAAASRVLAGMAGLNATPPAAATLGPVTGLFGLAKTSLAYVVIGLVVCWLLPSSQELVARYRALASRDAANGSAATGAWIIVWGVATSILLFAGAVWQFGADYDSPFLYFQF